MRRGFAILEVIVSCGLLAVLLVLCVQILSLMAGERRNLDRRAVALQEAANIVERVSTMPFDELDESHLAKIELAPEVQAFLPGSKVALHVAEESGDVAGKRVRVEITWRGVRGGPERPVQLTQWFWQRTAGAQP